jgi:hypothetical protein
LLFGGNRQVLPSRFGILVVQHENLHRSTFLLLPAERKATRT